MANKTYKLGELLELSDERNSDNKYNLDNIKGISTEKKFIETKANMDGVSLSSYKVVNKDEFAYVADTSRRGDKIALAYNNDNPVLISSIYTVFKVSRSDLLNSDYLYMYFNRPEFDRYSRFNSWGSAREVFSWEDFCDIDITLPDLKTQEKYVEIYEALVENQKSYESGLDDLKLTCDAYIEELRRKIPCEKIGTFIECTDRNTNDTNLKIQGISNQQKLIDSESRTQGVDKEKYIRIDPREFGYSPIHINDGSIAFNNTNYSYLLSPIYKTFKVLDEKKLHPEYLMMWFSRKEFTRYCWYYAFGSARDTFEWKQMCDVSIPIPDLGTQISISNIYKCYLERKAINEKLKSQIKDICPVLIKGSLEEAKEA